MMTREELMSLMLAAFILGDNLAILLGSTDTILPYAKSYLSIILIGAPWMTASIVLNNQLRFQGSAAYGMVGIVSGAVLNIILDPIMIFTMDLGVAGAGWATIISQFFSFCLLLVGCGRGGNIRIELKRFQLKPHTGWKPCPKPIMVEAPKWVTRCTTPMAAMTASP